MPLQSSFPAVYRRAGDASATAQNAFVRSSGVRLLALCAAGVLAEFDRMATWVAVAFGLALVLELAAALRRPEREWYGARAGAESVKTLAWRYAMGAAPFPRDVADPDALFARRVHDILGHSDHATDAMRDARASSLEARRALYRRERVADQLQWYERKAHQNERRARAWSVVLVLVEAGAFVAALLRAMGKIDFDLFGIVGTLGAAAAAWTQTRQHATLAAAYAVAAKELGMVAERIDDARDEAEWARFVADAEDAMSREHTMWRATHA